MLFPGCQGEHICQPAGIIHRLADQTTGNLAQQVIGDRKDAEVRTAEGERNLAVTFSKDDVRANFTWRVRMPSAVGLQPRQPAPFSVVGCPLSVYSLNDPSKEIGGTDHHQYRFRIKFGRLICSGRVDAGLRVVPQDALTAWFPAHVVRNYLTIWGLTPRINELCAALPLEMVIGHITASAAASRRRSARHWQRHAVSSQSSFGIQNVESAF